VGRIRTGANETGNAQIPNIDQYSNAMYTFGNSYGSGQSRQSVFNRLDNNQTYYTPNSRAACSGFASQTGGIADFHRIGFTVGAGFMW
jgi:hypothetical protein